jgi:hypothetical protein
MLKSLIPSARVFSAARLTTAASSPHPSPLALALIRRSYTPDPSSLSDANNSLHAIHNPPLSSSDLLRDSSESSELDSPSSALEKGVAQAESEAPVEAEALAEEDEPPAMTWQVSSDKGEGLQQEEQQPEPMTSGGPVPGAGASGAGGGLGGVGEGPRLGEVAKVVRDKQDRAARMFEDEGKDLEEIAKVFK